MLLRDAQREHLIWCRHAPPRDDLRFTFPRSGDSPEQAA
jgi:hypothetical protein